VVLHVMETEGKYSLKEQVQQRASNENCM